MSSVFDAVLRLLGVVETCYTVHYDFCRSQAIYTRTEPDPVNEEQGFQNVNRTRALLTKIRALATEP